MASIRSCGHDRHGCCRTWPPISLQRIAEKLIIGRETAKTQAMSIYRKLAVTSRGAAVVEAERLGLLSR